MTTPDWAVRIPNAPIHTAPPSYRLTPPIDADQMLRTMTFFLDAFIGQVAIAFGGIEIAGWKPFEFLTEWGQNLIDQASAAYLGQEQANNKIGGLATLFNLGSGDDFLSVDLTEIWTDVVDNILNPLDVIVANLKANIEANLQALLGINLDQPTGAFDPLEALFAGPVQVVQTTWDGVVEAWQGLFGVFTEPEARGAMTSAASTLAAHSSAIEALRAASSGVFVLVDFTTLPNTTNLPAAFSQTYAGGGLSTFGVSGGYAKVNPVFDLGSMTSIGRYSLTSTTGDNQVVCGVWAAQPMTSLFGARAFHILHGRWDTSNTYVSAQLAADYVEIGATVAGSRTVFGSGGFTFKANSPYYFLLGTSAGLRRFEVREGSPAGTLILGVTDSGSVSQLGAGYRYAGLGVVWEPGVPPILPGKMALWCLSEGT